MDYKESMELVGKLENSEEIISAITERISKANTSNIDYKASLAEKETEITGLKETNTSFLKDIGVETFDLLKSSFATLKEKGGESGEQALTITKLQTQIHTNDERFLKLENVNKENESKIQNSKKESVIKASLKKNGMIDSPTMVNAHMSSLSFDSENSLVNSAGVAVDDVLKKVLEEEPHLKASGIKVKGNSTFQSNSTSGDDDAKRKADLKEFLK